MSSISNKTLDQLVEADFQALISASVEEKQVLEYKQLLLVSRDDDKKEFLTDVASFANSAGGDILFGIRTVGGVPVELSGIDLSNIDAEKQRIDNLISNGITPRLRFELGVITLSNSKFLLIVRIPKSWTMPHAVILGGSWKFFFRTSSGKQQYDYSLLRRAFIQSESLRQNLKTFHFERLEKIENEELALSVKQPFLILHLLPFESFESECNIDVSNLRSIHSQLSPFSASSYDYFYNFDGFRTQSVSPNYLEYVQVFIDGKLECLSTEISFEHSSHNYLAVSSVEDDLLRMMLQVIPFYKSKMVNPPLAILLSLVNVRNLEFGSSIRFSGADPKPIDRNSLIFSPLIIHDYSDLSEPEKIASRFKPFFDSLWNSFGFSRCLDFNTAGRWQPNR